MTGKTHRAGGMLCSIVGFAILKKNGLLLPDVNEGLQWLVIYPFCMWGSVASDLDHHWESSPLKSYPDRMINIALHVTAPVQRSLDKRLTDSQKKKNVIYKVAKFFNANHRSWQTHSDLTLACMICLLWLVLSGKVPSFGLVDMAISSLILTGVSLGVIAHFILDMLTPEGVWCTVLVVLNAILRLFNPRINLPMKLHFVPKSKAFATGGKWELFVNKVLKVATVIAIVWFLGSLIFPLVQDKLPFEITIQNFLGGN